VFHEATVDGNIGVDVLRDFVVTLDVGAGGSA